MPLVDLTHDNFDAVTDAHALILLDFWAPWCAPCKGFAPVFAAAAEHYPAILFGRIDTEAEPKLAEQFAIQSIPTLLAVKDGEVLDVRVGALPPPQLAALIQKMLA